MTWSKLDYVSLEKNVVVTLHSLAPRTSQPPQACHSRQGKGIQMLSRPPPSAARTSFCQVLGKELQEKGLIWVCIFLLVGFDTHKQGMLNTFENHFLMRWVKRNMAGLGP